jgi:hypothetical protein
MGTVSPTQSRTDRSPGIFTAGNIHRGVRHRGYNTLEIDGVKDLAKTQRITAVAYDSRITEKGAATRRVSEP